MGIFSLLVAAPFALAAAPPENGDPVKRSFDCTTAAELLGQPGAKVVSCNPILDTDNLWFVWLDLPSGESLHRLVLLGDGPPFVGTGLAAMGRYLRESSLGRQSRMTEHNLRWYLKATAGYPPGWSEMDGGSGLSGPDETTSFRADPLSFGLYRRSVQPVATPEGTAFPPPAAEAPLERAVLEADPAGTWGWTLGVKSARGWTTVQHVPLEPVVTPR